MNQKTDDQTGSADEPLTHPPDEQEAEHPEQGDVGRELEETDLRHIVRDPEETPRRETATDAFEDDEVTGHEARLPDAEPSPAEEPAAGNIGGPAPAPGRRGLTAVVAWLSFLLALAALAAAAWLGWQGRGSGEQSTANARAIETLSEDVDQTAGDLGELQRQLGQVGEDSTAYLDELRSLERRVDQLAQQSEAVGPRLGNLEDAISSLQGVSAGAREAWMLAEAEYYLQIANAQLQLANEPGIALLALNNADERLRQMSDPGLTGVRRALSGEIQTLEAHDPADVEGVTLTLANLADRVDSLPLNEQVAESPAQAENTDPESSGVGRAWQSVKQAFGDLVSVRRADEDVRPLMSPDAADFLRANLAVQFQTARLAFLRGEQAVFRESLGDAADWLERYYDRDSTAVQRALETIAGIRDSRLDVTPPDISGSLRLLRQFRSQREAAAGERDTAGPAQ